MLVQKNLRENHRNSSCSVISRRPFFPFWSFLLRLEWFCCATCWWYCWLLWLPSGSLVLFEWNHPFDCILHVVVGRHCCGLLLLLHSFIRRCFRIQPWDCVWCASICRYILTAVYYFILVLCYELSWDRFFNLKFCSNRCFSLSFAVYFFYYYYSISLSLFIFCFCWIAMDSVSEGLMLIYFGFANFIFPLSTNVSFLPCLAAIRD